MGGDWVSLRRDVKARYSRFIMGSVCESKKVHATVSAVGEHTLYNYIRTFYSLVQHRQTRCEQISPFGPCMCVGRWHPEDPIKLLASSFVQHSLPYCGRLNLRKRIGMEGN